MNSVPCCIQTRIRNSKFQARKRGNLFGYLYMIWLIPRVLSYSAFLLASFLAACHTGGRAGEKPGNEVPRQAFEREGGKSEYSSVREQNRRARCPASSCHPVYEFNTSLRLAVGQLVNSFLSHPWGEDSAYERDGDASRKFWIKPLKETNLGVAQPFFFTPKSDHFKLWLHESSK